MTYITCKSDRINSVNAKCNDMCFIETNDVDQDGYVPRNLNIGGGDYIYFRYCGDCGQIQAEFPLDEIKLK